MSKRDTDILFFVAFCIEGYKNKHALSGEAVSRLFDEHGIKEYLAEHYDVLHTQVALKCIKFLEAKEVRP